MAKIESLPINVVWNLTKQELMSCCGTTNVEIIGVGYAGEYEDIDHLEDCPLLVNAFVDNATNEQYNGQHPWLMIWNEDECDFHTLMRLDQKTNDNNK